MRKNEAIWIEKSQRWQIKVQKDGKRKAFYSTKSGKKGKIEAEKKADAWLETGEDDGRRRLEKVWEEWLDWQMQVNGSKNPTYQKNRSIGKNYVLPEIGWKMVGSIKVSDWQRVIDQAYIERSLSRKMLMNIRGALTSFYSFCRRQQLPICKPEDLVIPRAAKVGERKILQPDDIRKLAECDTIMYRGKEQKCFYINYFRFAVYTGMRPGEILGLRWDDIRDGVLTIRRAINVQNEETAGKNRNAKRSIYLTQYALHTLEAQKAMLRACSIISPWVFPGEDGTPTTEQMVYRYWRRWCDHNGVENTSLYELRHTFVSINADVPDALLKQMVGHSATMDTRGVYGHEVDGQNQQAAAMVEAAFDRIKK